MAKLIKHDMRLSNGLVFLPGTGLAKVDLLCAEGRITGIVARDTVAEASEEHDLRNAWVLPGAIDPHVHLGKDITTPQDDDDARLETASAVAGGVTTMLPYLMSPRPYGDVFDSANSVMAANSYTDYGFHMCLVTPEQVTEMRDYVDTLGVSSFKFFMNFRGDEGAYLGLPGNDDSFMYDLLGAAADAGAMVNPHAENIEIVWRLREAAKQADVPPLEAWNRARPPFVEAEAEQRVAYLASVTGASVYAVHTSSEQALRAINRQRVDYADLFVETCPHYLTLSTRSQVGTYGKVNPPLRDQSDVEALWDGLNAGAIDTVGSDHVPRHKSAKEKDVWSASAGFPGTGTMLPLLLSEGLRRGVPLSQIVDLTSTRAARLFGLYPRKGAIQVGADADLVVIDPNSPSVIHAADLHSGSEYTPWEDHALDVCVKHTLVGGRFAFNDGVVAEKCTGRYLRRKSSGRRALESQEAAPDNNMAGGRGRAS